MVGAQAKTVFYRASGQANNVFVEVRRPGYILEPILQLNPLDTQVMVNSAGTRDSLASLLNPGPIGDFPALLGLAIAGLPPIPYPGYPLTVKASHPVTPEANLGVGDVPGGSTADAFSLRPLTVSAKADEDSAEATGTGASLNLAAGLVKVGGLVTRTDAVDDGGTVTITAVSTIGSIDIAGLIHIDGLKTMSVAKIDAEGSRVDSSTTVGRIEALGAELRLDDEGLHVVSILGLPAPPPVLLEPITRNLQGSLARLGLNVRLADGSVAEGPADGQTTVQGGSRGLEISLPVTIPADVPIPSLPIPLGIPVGGGIPTTVTIALGRTQIAALTGSGDGFDAGELADLGGSPDLAPAPAGGIGTGSFDLPSSGVGAAGPGVASPATPSAGPQVGTVTSTVSASRPDLAPAFRWTLVAAAAVIAAGWPTARRRAAGVAGLSASAVLRSMLNPRRIR